MSKSNSSNYGLYIGLVLFILMSIGIGIGSFNPMYVFDSIYGIIDWLAALIPYFFYFALLGLIVDFFVQKKRKLLFEFPLWAKFTLAIIIVGIIVSFLYIRDFSFAGLLFYLSFPFYYAIFFSGYSYLLISSDLFSTNYTAKLFLDLLFLTFFFSWLYLEVRTKNDSKYSKFRKWFISIIYLVITCGMINLIRNLG